MGTRNDPAAARIFELSIDGMAREACVRSVRNVLERIQGATGAEVASENARATMTYERARTDVKTLKEAVTDADYQAA